MRWVCIFGAMVMPLAFGAVGCGSSGAQTKGDDATAPAAPTADDSAGAPAAAAAVTGMGGSFVSNREGSSSAKCDMGGSREAAALKTCISSYIDGVRECYRSALVGDEALQGKIRVGFTILADGSTDGVSLVESSVKDMDFEKCVLDAASGWMFPAGTGKLKVEYPFKFRPASDD